jgi:riboflavin biosynthesis pyrimidine reductase
MPKLYELSSQYNQIFYTMTEESDFNQLEETLAAIEEEFEVKAENIAKLIKSLDGDAKAYKEEVDRLSSRKKTIENHQDRLKAYLESNMTALGKDKIKGNVFTIAMQNNPPRAVVDSEGDIPECYKVTEIHIVKSDILRDLKQGKEIPGAHIEQSVSLRIR